MNAEQVITNAGLRTTKARLAVLNAIIEAKTALSQPEILTHLAHQAEFDRVTIYRVLDWLTEHQIVHKISGDNRAVKFQVSQRTYTAVSSDHTQKLLNNHHQHAHLHCQQCGKVICVHELAPHFPTETLVKYQVSSIDINIKGVCMDCAQVA